MGVFESRDKIDIEISCESKGQTKGAAGGGGVRMALTGGPRLLSVFEGPKIISVIMLKISSGTPGTDHQKIRSVLTNEI